MCIRDSAGPSAQPPIGTSGIFPARVSAESPSNIPDQGGYIPDQGGYIPDQGGYIPDQGGYISDQGGYIPFWLLCTPNRLFRGVGGVAEIFFSHWNPIIFVS